MRLTHLGRLCFLHIPKTAGTSLRLWLEELFDVAACCPYYHPYEFAQRDQGELTHYELFSGHFGWKFVASLSPSSAITFLRDPADRTISALRYLRAFTPEQDRMYRDRTWVKGWVLDLLNKTSNVDLVTMPRFISEGNEQTRQLSDPRATTLGHHDLQAAIDNLKTLDAFGLVEDMDRSVLLLCDALGLPARSMAIRANVTARNESHDESEQALEAARSANKYDGDLYLAAKCEFDVRWSHLLARHGLAEETNRRTLADRINRSFRSTERGVARLSALSLDPSHGAVADGWKERFFYHPVQRWIKWSRTNRPCVWLPIDRSHCRTMRVEIAYTSDTAVRDSVTIEIDGMPVQIDRSYEIWPEDQNHHLVLSAPIPPCPTSPQYTEVAFQIPINASERASMALSRIAVGGGCDVNALSAITNKKIS